VSFIAKQTEYLPFGAFTLFKFPKPSPCGENLNFCQPTEQFDDVAFQFLASESENLVVNGDFGSNFVPAITGWTFVGWSIEGDSTGNIKSCQVGGVNTLSQKGILTVNDHYRVTIKVTDFPGGTLVVGAGTGSSIFNGILTIQSNGTFTAFFQYTEVGGDGDFIITGSAASSIGICVDDVEVIRIASPSDYTVQIHDGVTFALIDTVPAANVTIEKNVITVDFNWTDDVVVPNGCVVFRIFDDSSIFEDTFATNQGWTIGSETVIDVGLMTYTSTGASNASFIDNIFIPGESYEITYTTSGVTGTGAVTVICGRTVGTIRSTNGTFVETLTCTDITRLQFNFDGANLSTVSIDNIVITKSNNLDGQSECLELATSHDCTLLWVWSNNESWGSFDYSLGFEHKLRVECKFRGVSYPRERNNGENSAGKRSVDYSSLKKSPSLDINWAAIHIHDAIASHFEQDNRTIDGVSYFLDDEYEPSAPNDSIVIFKDLMTATIELEKTDQPNQINRKINGI